MSAVQNIVQTVQEGSAGVLQVILDSDPKPWAVATFVVFIGYLFGRNYMSYDVEKANAPKAKIGVQANEHEDEVKGGSTKFKPKINIPSKLIEKIDECGNQRNKFAKIVENHDEVFEPEITFN